MYRINQKVKRIIFFVSRILVAVIVNLVVILQTQNPVYYFHLVLLYVLLVLTGLLLKNYIQIRCLFGRNLK
jgi:hypothetical protein